MATSSVSFVLLQLVCKQQQETYFWGDLYVVVEKAAGLGWPESCSEVWVRVYLRAPQTLSGDRDDIEAIREHGFLTVNCFALTTSLFSFLGNFANAENNQGHFLEALEEKDLSNEKCYLERHSIYDKAEDQPAEEIGQHPCPRLDRKRKHSGERVQNDGSQSEGFVDELQDECVSKAKKKKSSKGKVAFCCGLPHGMSRERNIPLA